MSFLQVFANNCMQKTFPDLFDSNLWLFQVFESKVLNEKMSIRQGSQFVDQLRPLRSSHFVNQ